MKQLTFDEKIKEYQGWVLENKKTPPKSANIKFSDGGDMRSWAHNWRRYVRDFIKEYPKEPLPEKYQKIQSMCEFIESSFDGKLQLSAQRPDMEARINEYIEITRKLGRRPVQKDHLTFKDGMDMVCWYNATNQIYGRNSQLEDILEQPEESLHPFARMKKKLCEEGYYKDQFWRLSHSTYTQKTKEYLEWVKIHKCIPSIHEKFSDGVRMEAWYRHQNLILHSEVQKQLIPSSDRMEEIMSFAWMENEILKVKDIRSIRKPRMTYDEKMKYFNEHMNDEGFDLNSDQLKFPDETSVKNWVLNHKSELKEWMNQPPSLSFEGHVLEYLEMAKAEGTKLNTRDARRFSNHHVAASWLLNKECEVRRKRKSESAISNLQMGELYILALLDDYLYTLEHTLPESKPLDTAYWVKRIKSSI